MVKICIKCNIEYSLEDNFYKTMTKNKNYYSNTCKKCVNIINNIRRKQNAINNFKKSEIEVSTITEMKNCSKCGIQYQNTNVFFPNDHQRLSTICKKCTAKHDADRKSIIRKCVVCKLDFPLTEEHFKKNTKKLKHTFSTRCNGCVINKRFKPEKEKLSMEAYRKKYILGGI